MQIEIIKGSERSETITRENEQNQKNQLKFNYKSVRTEERRRNSPNFKR